MMFSFIDIFAHIGQGFQTAGSLFKDMLWFRSFLVVGIAFEMIYQFKIDENPLWSLIIWSALFITINLVQIGLIIYERMRLNFTEDEKRLYVMTFSNMKKTNFKRLMSAAKWNKESAGCKLVKNNTFLPELLLIFKGIADVIVGGEIIATLRQGQFVGEMSFLTGKPASANVVATTDVTIISWEKEKLQKLLKKDPETASALQHIFNTDLINKLIKKNK